MLGARLSSRQADAPGSCCIAGAFPANGFPEKKTPPQVGLVAGF